MKYPQTRLRRLRFSPWIRDIVAETRLSVADLIWPFFVTDQPKNAVEIPSLPGIFRLTLDQLAPAAHEALALGIRAIAVFPQTDPNLKSPDAAEAVNPENLVCRSVAIIKREAPELGVICDVALDPYSSHGHDGLVIGGEIVNDQTVDLLCQQAIVQARAGCDIIAPSDMMDGRVGKIRQELDKAGFQNVAILSYAAKYASAFYGPFREAVGSAANLGMGDKKTYQMNPANSDEALREVEMDIAEGADMVMVKPAMPYMDIIHRVKSKFKMPTFAYQVSGEYAMISAAANNGWLDRSSAILESLTCLKRAGADAVITYFAKEAALYLQNEK
jgi:porphobilinogen synthase